MCSLGNSSIYCPSQRWNHLDAACLPCRRLLVQSFTKLSFPFSVFFKSCLENSAVMGPPSQFLPDVMIQCRLLPTKHFTQTQCNDSVHIITDWTLHTKIIRTDPENIQQQQNQSSVTAEKLNVFEPRFLRRSSRQGWLVNRSPSTWKVPTVVWEFLVHWHRCRRSACCWGWFWTGSPPPCQLRPWKDSSQPTWITGTLVQWK